VPLAIGVIAIAAAILFHQQAKPAPAAAPAKAGAPFYPGDTGGGGSVGTGGLDASKLLDKIYGGGVVTGSDPGGGGGGSGGGGSYSSSTSYDLISSTYGQAYSGGQTNADLPAQDQIPGVAPGANVIGGPSQVAPPTFNAGPRLSGSGVTYT
jgi:hypothetical protein